MKEAKCTRSVDSGERVKMTVREKEKVSEPKGERPFKYEGNSIEKQKGKTATINGR
jgi:hypothetical protein